MKLWPKRTLIVLGLLVLAVSIAWRSQRDQPGSLPLVEDSGPAKPPPVHAIAKSEAAEARCPTANPAAEPPLTEEEQHKQIDRDHLRKIHEGPCETPIERETLNARETMRCERDRSFETPIERETLYARETRQVI